MSIRLLFIDKIKGLFNKNQSYGNHRSSDGLHKRVSKVEEFLSEFPVQFTIGHVVECITNRDSILSLNRDINMNAIKAIKHTGGVVDSNQIESLQSDTYYPLMRGIVDAPTQGDPVLLCEFAGRKYYIGPLNTINSPNFNPDILLKLDGMEKYQSGQSNLSSNMKRALNINPHFPATNKIKRLWKPINNMDFAGVDIEGPINRSVGDLMFEGRFGNSIRIGSRSGRPNIFISNGRNQENRVESLNDGCLITMTSIGALKDHFTFPRQNIQSDFNLPSNINNKHRPIDYDNTYNKSQILILSNRLIFASRSDSILLSSHFDVQIGCGRNFEIYTKSDTIIKSKNIYLGEGEGEPIVLGDKLVDILGQMIDAIGQCNVAGIPISGMSGPLSGGTTPGWSQLMSIKSQLETIKSKYAFVQAEAGK